ncbi:MAG: hypothetical protein KF889_24025 [Alphaproteobacteria bacterium]|nr:hypothetical protein [Alphaproteobacteria bacterium]MCW5742526.1 hypothetical protein [Alphaproteobacteria bacterium]
MNQTLRVDVVDMLGKGMNQVALAVRTNNRMSANPTVLVEFTPQGDRFDSFVVQVTRSVSMMQRSISALRLWAHAVVFDLRDDIPTGKAMLGDRTFTVADVRSRRATFASLKPYFSGHANTRFEFRGCGVANLDGLVMMKELAALWDVRVHAAELNQGAGMYWDGPVIEALPDGTLRRIAGLGFDAAY